MATFHSTANIDNNTTELSSDILTYQEWLHRVGEATPHPVRHTHEEWSALGPAGDFYTYEEWITSAGT